LGDAIFNRVRFPGEVVSVLPGESISPIPHKKPAKPLFSKEKK
jgi:hypothetical protein